MIFKKAILAGIVVSIFSYNYLLNYDLLAKIVFSIALVVLVRMELNLYTSKVAIISLSEGTAGSKAAKILAIFLGNTIACLVFCSLFALLGETHAPEVWAAKMNLDVVNVLIKAVIVGMVMQMGALTKSDIVCMGAVLIFICTGGEHAIANIAYMTLAGAFSLKAIWHIFLCLIGNSLGGMLIFWLNRERKPCKV